ncbi:hypothetical protein V5O48_006716 [Marasmius crinis-equi]|uniref:Uncharacterized protein n=1 Tax=Marasmius crinis-equi TaxID=585013 RepID=A0ABR3FJ52_9AGAR
MSPRAYQTPGEEEDKLMWRTLSRNFARCHRITLDMPQITSLNLRPSRSWDGTFPSLTSLIIRSEGSTPDSQFWQSFQSASKLTKVTISLRVAHWPEHIPYPQLVSLELTRLALHETENLLIKLNRCSSLRFLTLGDIQTGAMTIPPHIHVEMPLLQTLSIGFQGRGVVLYNSRYDSLYGLMEALSLPSLIEFRLHLIVEEQSGGVWPHPLLAMLKSATILRKVSLSLTCSDTISSTYGLYDLLKQTPNLTHFEFSLSRDRGRYSGVRAYRARADALISEVFFELGSRPDTFLPKVQCLSLRVMDITLNKETVSNVIGVAKLRGESHGAGSGNDRCSLKSLRLARFRVSPLEPEFILDDLLVSRIGELEKSGVKVIVEDLSDPGADGNVFLL